MTKIFNMSFLNFEIYDIKMTKYGKNDKQMTKMGVVCMSIDPRLSLGAFLFLAAS